MLDARAVTIRFLNNKEGLMANTTLSMRKIKEFLRLTHHGSLSDRQVALSLDISLSTVKEYRARAQRAGLSWRCPRLSVMRP